VQTLLGHIERWLAYSQAPLEDCAGEKEIMSKIKFFKITFGLFVFISVLSIYMAVTV